MRRTGELSAGGGRCNLGITVSGTHGVNQGRGIMIKGLAGYFGDTSSDGIKLSTGGVRELGAGIGESVVTWILENTDIYSCVFPCVGILWISRFTLAPAIPIF